MKITRKILELFTKKDKKFYSLQEVINFTGGGKEVVKVSLSRLVSQKKLFGLGHGFYTLSPDKVDVESLACQLIYPSYISFEYALWLHGIYNQIPAALTLATAAKTKKLLILDTSIEYSHLKKELFCGYALKGKTLIASPEKALLDELYLIGLGKRSISLQELDLGKINKTKLKKWLPFYPSSTAKKLGKYGL